MDSDLITLHVCAKKGESRVFISKSDYDKVAVLGYLVSVAANKEYYVPTSSKLYEHHFELTSICFPESANVVINVTPFVYNAYSVKSTVKVK